MERKLLRGPFAVVEKAQTPTPSPHSKAKPGDPGETDEEEQETAAHHRKQKPAEAAGLTRSVTNLLSVRRVSVAKKHTHTHTGS